jgi:hypothetical protein
MAQHYCAIGRGGALAQGRTRVTLGRKRRTINRSFPAGHGDRAAALFFSLGLEDS